MAAASGVESLDLFKMQAGDLLSSVRNNWSGVSNCRDRLAGVNIVSVGG